MVDEVTDAEFVLFYQMAGALVFPARYEGFGLPPLEAKAADCPVVASNRASLPEVCGEAALLVDPERREELADAMQRVGREAGLRKDLIERGKKQVAKFSWEETGKQYGRVFQETFFR